MITIQTKKENNIIKEIILTGHAGYDIYGKDIVCSGVSAIVITTVNGIIRLDSTILEVIQEENKLSILVKKDTLVSRTLLDNMMSLLEEARDTYPKNIQIK